VVFYVVTRILKPSQVILSVLQTVSVVESPSMAVVAEVLRLIILMENRIRQLTEAMAPAALRGSEEHALEEMAGRPARLTDRMEKIAKLQRPIIQTVQEVEEDIAETMEDRFI
jgi:hypothetical protein